MSVQRSFAQRNNNVVDVVPERPTSGYWEDTYLLKIDPTSCSIFNVDVSQLETDGTYGLDSTINRYGYTNTSQTVPRIYTAIILDPTVASRYPGLEFTVNFVVTSENDASVSVYPTATLTTNGHIDQMISPFYGFNSSNIQSLTLKSNGTFFAVVSSGVTPWYYVD